MASTYNIAFYFPDSEFLPSPQTFGITGSMTVLDTQTFINSQVPALPVTVPPKTRWFSVFGQPSILYAPQYSWSSIIGGVTGSTFNVSVVENIPVRTTVNYTTGSTSYILPDFPSQLTFTQLLNYLSTSVIGGTYITLDIQSPVILSTSKTLSEFATPNGSSATGPYLLTLQIAQSTPATVNIYQLGASGSLILTSSLSVFPDWTIASVEVQFKEVQGRTAISERSTFYPTTDINYTTPYGSTVVLSTLAVSNVVSLLVQNTITTRSNNMFTFFGTTLISDGGPTTVLGSEAWQVVDATQQYLPTVLSISPLDSTSMGNFTLAMSLLPSFPLTVPVKTLPILDMRTVIPNDSTNYVIQDISDPPMICKVTLFTMDAVGATPSQLSTQIRLCLDSVVSVKPSPLTQTISGNSWGTPTIEDPSVLLADVMDENSEVSLYLVNNPPIEVNFQLPNGTFLTLHNIETDTTISELLSTVQISVSNNFSVQEDCTLWFGTTQLSMGSSAMVSEFTPSSFALQWKTVQVQNSVTGVVAIVSVPRLSSPTTTLYNLIELSIAPLHFVDNIAGDYHVLVGGAQQIITKPVYPYVQTLPTVTFVIRPTVFSGFSTQVLVGLGSIATIVSTAIAWWTGFIGIF